ncbi:MAG: signal peptide peptidase SppA [Planctomycetota bacterium]
MTQSNDSGQPTNPPPFQGPSWPPPQGGGAPPPPQPPPPPGPPPPPPPGQQGPPGGYPPPYWRPQRPQQQQPRRNTGLAITLLVLAVVVGIWAIVNAGSTRRTTTVATGGGNLTETITDGAATASYKVAIVDVSGVIISGGESTLPIPGFAAADPVQMVRDALARVTADPRVKGLIMRINSPGGGLTDSDVLHHEIVAQRDAWAAAGRSVKLVVLMGDVAASGAYYISAPADQIFAHPTTLTGSIGVILSGWNYAGLMEKWGVADSTVTSVPHKDMGSPFRQPQPFERQWFKGLLEEMHEQFVDAVWKGRVRVHTGLTIADVRAWADGRVYTAQQAKKMKLIDQIGYEEDAVQWIASQYNLNETPMVVHYDREAPKLSLFPFGQAPVQGPGAATDNMNAAGVAAQLDALREYLRQHPTPQSSASPRLWALWPGN